jgi:lysophospholipase L1-like esterase
MLYCSQSGFGCHLSEYYEGRRVDVINRGFSGYNSRWISQIMDDIVTDDNIPHTICTTILLGSNDSVEAGQAQHISLEEYKSNLTSIIGHLRSQKESILVILITPPPVDHEVSNYCSKIFIYS